MQATDVISGIDENLDIELTAFQLWDEKLNLFAFTSPKLGLNRYDADINNVTSQPQPVAPSPIKSQQHEAGKNCADMIVTSLTLPLLHHHQS